MNYSYVFVYFLYSGLQALFCGSVLSDLHEALSLGWQISLEEPGLGKKHSKKQAPKPTATAQYPTI